MPPALSDYETDSVAGSDCTSEVAGGATDSKMLVNDDVCAPIMELMEALGIYGDMADTEEGSDSLQGPEAPAQTAETAAHEAVPVQSTEPKGKKRSSLLAGLDLDNVVQEDLDEVDDVQVSTNSRLLSKIRPRRNSVQKSELCYDQKYHPMDDYVKPKQASKLKQKYGEDPLSSSSFADRYEDDTERETDFEEEADQWKGKKHSKRANTDFSLQPTRRSSRAVNRNVVYNTNIHPQDKQLKELELTSICKAAKTKKSTSLIEDDLADQGSEPDEANSEDLHDMHAPVVMHSNNENATTESEDENVVMDSEDDGDDLESLLEETTNAIAQHLAPPHSDRSSPFSNGTPFPLTPTNHGPSGADAAISHLGPHMFLDEGDALPLSSFSTGDAPGSMRSHEHDVLGQGSMETRPRNANELYPTAPGSHFNIYTEPDEVQEATLAAGGVSRAYENDDDKENKVTNPELAQVPDPLEGLNVQSLEVFRNETDGDGADLDDLELGFTGQSFDSRFDTTSSLVQPDSPGPMLMGQRPTI